MKFFHLSDLHIGLKLINRDLREDQAYIFEQIAHAAADEQPDAIVIAGDIYDRAVPSAEAVDLFDDFLDRLRQAVPDAVIMMISGNHDSANRVNVYRNILARENVYMVGQPPRREGEMIEQVTLTDVYGEVHFYLLPFVRPSVIREITGTDEHGNLLSYDRAVHALIEREQIDRSARNVLVSHQFYIPAGKEASEIERMDSEIPTVGNIDAVGADILDRFDYAALGHIHKPMCVGGETARYCGTPLPCSVSEAGQRKGIVFVEMTDELRIRVIDLQPLRRVCRLKGTLEEILTQSCDDYVSVILTDKRDLELIDMRERLDAAFPHLLQVRRESERSADYTHAYSEEDEQLDPFDLCCRFLQDLDDDEKDLLQDVINTVTEVNG